MAFIGIRVPIECGRLLKQIDIEGEKGDTLDLHITLLYFTNENQVAEISKSIEIVYDVISNIHPFTVKMEKVSHFPKNQNNQYHIITRVKSPELHALRDALVDEFDKHGIQYNKQHKKYQPHVSLAISDTKPKDFKFYPIEFRVQEIILIGSEDGNDKIFVTLPLAGL